VCDHHVQSKGSPVTILFAETANEDENLKVVATAIQETMVAGNTPLMPYLYSIGSKECVKKITGGMIDVSKAVLVFGSMDQSLETYLDDAIMFGIPVYFTESETCLPNNPAMAVVLKAVQQAIEGHKGDESICLIIDSKKEKAVLEFEHGQYRSDQILSTAGFTDKEYLFLERYIYKNLNCEILCTTGQYSDYIFEQIEPTYMVGPF